MKSSVVQSSFLSGVLDPRASARIETDAYNNGMLVGLNIEPIHLGGVRRRAGLKFRAQLPNILTRITSGVTVTAPNGGTTANANDDDTTTSVTTTTPVGTTNDFVVVHYDLGSSKALAFVDVLGIALTAGTSAQFRIQKSADNSIWDNMVPSGSSAINLAVVDTTPRDYRYGDATARYLRVVRIGTTDLGSANATLTGFNVWQDSGTVSEVRLVPFEASDTARYLLAFTDRSITVVEDGAFLDRIPAPYASADLADMDAATRQDEMVIVHEDYPPRLLFEDADEKFQSRVIVFENIPQIDYNDSSSPTPVSDVQVITFNGSWVVGNTLQITLEGARSGPIVFAGDADATQRATTAANIAREVQKLWTVEGFDGVTCSRTGALAYTVTFANASAAAYDLLSVTPLVAASGAAATVAQSAVGTARSEDMWSATRGYPRTVALYEGRMYLGGTRSRQQTIAASKVNVQLDFDIGEGLDDDAILTTLDGQQLSSITGLYAGRNLQLFTAGAEFRYAKQQGTPITPADAPANQTQYGAAKVRPVSIDGATIFVQRNRKSVRDFRFDYTEDAFNSLGISSLAPHLLTGIVDIASWNGSAADEINFVFVVNGDGTVAIYNSRKESSIQAWVQWTTQGLFKAVGVVVEDRYFAVKRTIANVDVLMLEQADNDYYTDCSVQTTNSPASTTAVGFTHLNGQEIRVRADGFIMANATPAIGQITLERISTEVEGGFGFNPAVTPMPLNTMVPSGANFMRKRRVVKVRAKVRNTLGLLINGRPIPDRRFDINNFDEAPTPVTAVLTLEETSNWDETEEKTVTFSQVDPLPFELLGIEVQLESSE